MPKCLSFNQYNLLCKFVHYVYVIIIILIDSDCSLNMELNVLCRVGHVCATCFIDYNWAFRLLWLHCFKPYEHQFTGKVNAVYDFSKSALCRVRKPPAGVIQQCLVKYCTNGRKCTKAHSTTEFQYWNVQRGIYYVTLYI